MEPEKAIKLLGKVLPRLFEYLLEAPAATPVLSRKVDLLDRFWRMKVPKDQKWNFVYVMWDKEGERTRIFPLSPQDGMVPVTRILLHGDGGIQGGDDTSERDEEKIRPVANGTFHGTSRSSQIHVVSD